MGFELTVRENIPIESEKDIKKVLTIFLTYIGYITKGNNPDVPLRIFTDCFVRRQNKLWTADDIAFEVGISKTSVYRHLKKLKNMDLLEETFVDIDDKKKKAYRFRYSSFAKAWNFTEAHAKVALENYRKTVEHIQELIDEKVI